MGEGWAGLGGKGGRQTPGKAGHMECQRAPSSRERRCWVTSWGYEEQHPPAAGLSPSLLLSFLPEAGATGPSPLT